MNLFGLLFLLFILKWPGGKGLKDNQIMKFGQVIILIFFKNYVENEAERLVPDLFSYFKKALYEVKACGLQLSFNIF